MTIDLNYTEEQDSIGRWDERLNENEQYDNKDQQYLKRKLQQKLKTKRQRKKTGTEDGISNKHTGMVGDGEYLGW